MRLERLPTSATMLAQKALFNPGNSSFLEEALASPVVMYLLVGVCDGDGAGLGSRSGPCLKPFGSIREMTSLTLL